MSCIFKTEIEKVDFTYPSETEDHELNNMLAKCGEIFMQSRQQNELFIFLCTLCNKTFNTIVKYANHIEYEHLIVDDNKYEEEHQDILTVIEEETETTAGYSSHMEDKQENCELKSINDHDNLLNKHNDGFENLIEIESDDSASEYLKFTPPYKDAEGLSPSICLLNADEINDYKPRAKQKRKTMQKLYQCTKCSKYFKRKSNLKTHELSHQLVKPFACTKCSASFTNKQNLVIHERRHTGEKPFDCSFCNKSFVSSTEKNSHLRKHTGERPYICEDCGKGLTTSSQLLEHRKQHTDERRYTCGECQKSFRTNTHLRTHKNAIHANLPRSFSCTQCEANFKTSLALYQHSKIHAKEKHYKCRICGKAFAQHPGLYAHMKIHEKNDALMTKLMS